MARIILAGIGKPAKYDALAAQSLGGRLVAALNGAGEKEAVVWVEGFGELKLAETELARQYRLWRAAALLPVRQIQDQGTSEQKLSLKRFTVLTTDATGARKEFDPMDKTADAVNFTRDLVSEPANVIYPETLAEEARTLTELGVEVKVLGVKEMTKLGMGALLGVGQGSVREPARHHAWNIAADEASSADRLCRQGRHLRHRRHLDQAGRRHGRHEVGHGRRRRRHRPDARARRAQGQGQRGRHRRAWSRTCRPARRSGRATSSPPCRARRSRC